MADNGMVLQEVFGSDLSSDEEEERLRHARAPPDKPSSRDSSPSPRAVSPAPASSSSRPSAAAAVRAAADSDDDDDDDDAPLPRPSTTARRPIQFSDSDDDDEPARARARRSARSDDDVSDGAASDDESDEDARRRRDKGSRKRKGASHSRKSKKARIRRHSDDDDRPADPDRDFIDDDGPDGPGSSRRTHDGVDDDVIRTEGGWHVSDEIEAPKGEEGDDEPEEEQKKPKTAFERALEENKALRRPRRKEIDPAKIEAECVTFLERMMRARDDDMKAYKSGKPALNKLKMLREVELMVMKVSHREQLMDNMLLAIIKAWLDPMPDGALPNVEIRSSLLQILSTIRVDADWVERLESSQGLGRVIHYLSRKDDHPPNRRLAGKLMMKWARPVYQSNSNFHDLLEEFDKPEEGRRAPKEGVASERRAARETVKHFQTAQEKMKAFKSKPGKGEDEQVLAAIPRRTPFLFTTLAEGSASIDDKQLREMRNAKARNKKVNRTMSTLRRANKNRSARAAKPSLNGR